MSFVVESLLLSLRACAEPTRLRLLALAARGAFCVFELTEILGQSQPRLSRHLRVLCEAGLLERAREGVNAWFTLPQGASGALARDLVGRLPQNHPILEADRRMAARVLAERARVASERFVSEGADWDEMNALALPVAEIEAALLGLLPNTLGDGRLLDIGTGTGRVLELLAARIQQGIGIDASRAMLALARARLARAGLSHCTVRQGDMYRLPFADAAFDLAVLQMVLHYAEDPPGVLSEAARILRPGGALLLVELGAHDRADLTERFAHRWPGFGADELDTMLREAGLAVAAAHDITGALPVRLTVAASPPGPDMRVVEPDRTLAPAAT
jgi:ArsR family transcriptional regulator